MENSGAENQQQKMPTLKIFLMIQKNLSAIGIDSKPAVKVHPVNLKFLMPILTLIFGAACMFMYMSNEIKSYSKFMQSIYLCTSFITDVLILAVMLLNSGNFFTLISDYESIVNTKFKYSSLQSTFTETHHRVEKLSEIIFFVMVKISPAVTILLSFFYSYFNYFTTEMGSDAFTSSGPLWFPFDWQTPFGYLIAIAMESMMATYSFSISACVLMMGIGLYLFVITMSKSIKVSLFSINQKAGDKSERKQLMERLIEFFEYHSRVQQLVHGISTTMQHFITILFVFSLVNICGALLMIQIELKNRDDDNWAELLSMMILVMYAFGFLLMVCEICQRINLAFEECSEMIDQFDWYLFPPEIQRMLPLILTFTQQPIEVKFFGSIPCGRPLFKYVIKTTYSYFSVLREFYI